MGYEELLKNVKDGLIKAASEGKKKALTTAYPKIKDAYDKIFDEAKEKFAEELKKICGIDENEDSEANDDSSNK